MKALIKSKLRNIKNTLLLVVILGVITAGMFSCEKYYMKKWTGQYVGEYIYSFTTPEYDHVDTTKNALFNVSILSDDGLLITYYKGKEWQVKINKDGYFEPYAYQSHYYYSGNFRSDSIIMSGESWSQASISRHSYKGKKISK